MSSRHRRYPTRHRIGPFRLVTVGQHRGVAIIDERTGRYAFCTPHPVTGRPIPEYLPTIDAALRIAHTLNEHR